MADYAVVFADLVTGIVRERFPLQGLRFSRSLNGVGAFSGTLLYADRRQLAKNPLGVTTLARTVAYVERNESQIVWGGIVWQRRRASRQQGQARLDGTEFHSWLRRREIVHTLTFAQQDQLAIARDLVLYAQGQAMQAVTGHPITYAKPGGSIGLTVGPEVSGILRDRTYEVSEHKMIGEALEQLAAVDQGFDFSVDPVYTAGVGSSITRPLALSYPRRGRTAGATFLRFAFGENMTEYDWPEDATDIATTSYALGQGEGADMLQSSASAQYLIDAGWPLLETSRSYKDVSIQTTLDAHARADSLADGVPAVILPKITVDGSMDPEVGDYVTGDECLIVIDDENFPSNAPTGDQSINTYMRILAYEVQVDDEGRESVTVTLGPVVA